MSACRWCGKTAHEIQGWLARVNPTGQTGVWECRPACGVVMSLDERIVGALEDEASDEGEEKR
jgi:hypothetical protein